MINTIEFVKFVKEVFSNCILFYEEFKTDLHLFEVDCLNDKLRKLSIEVSSDSVKVSAVNKEPELDFSLHDYSFDSKTEAEKFLTKIKESGNYKDRIRNSGAKND